MVDRDKRLNIRASADELAMLDALAERDGITVSDFLRMHIRRLYADAFGTRKPPKTAKK